MERVTIDITKAMVPLNTLPRGGNEAELKLLEIQIWCFSSHDTSVIREENSQIKYLSKYTVSLYLGMKVRICYYLGIEKCSGVCLVVAVRDVI